ncbi:hypothetical protein COW36_13870 [bacterium (Candidatus Blackallbacteria) CG17_big_fil_post_rev_8_21_14_2_50_48_46]|uniref:Flagellar hook protein FlgE/F/G-like D1 domain-containing protein n=1 Tax=bacterium (Candidatus Blackallbacteria) CG17_big_fil_post_rev_8_21_14_2_50_48_46 TaxID=2014261 RepID=A0A2M7G309_9BACT|nr:MAG: hypothetical protein COW64_23345 [bacterium (Candidatus Blackallbacteria) CG18_big_fil_WC_8_21_14_2_50_49_26]PIW16214.1 MAG: hypothetical protein COW36_13870 [bacterium (Candidatus Blackallbacteria) CG17_big_fil_post_rev_8_21_14_2_50_48_46]PIW49903.1 MAG: hypothetical protein COW20_04435 [bacterium (Candidatus Blackallbacteria) CG13_big_fil_rev_8_21_14_2_50_49_14]
MSLDKIGVNSLLAVNSWIGMINSNMEGTSRTGFKPTRISLSDGLGQLTTTNKVLDAPPSTLSVQATTIEWGQGSIVNSESSSHFAIQGEGFFVLADNFGRYFLSRDGEFHWDQNGFLVNSAGLKVVSSGEEFIRKDVSDRSDIFSVDGYSKELLKHGDKSFMLVSVANRDGLLMSQYGSTVFQVDGDLPLRVQNSFESTTDGVTYIYDDPDILASVNDPNFVTVPPSPVGTNTDFSIDLGVNGLFNFNLFNPLGVGTQFNPTTNSIDHIVTAINAYGATVGGRVSAYFDQVADHLVIRNEQIAVGDNTNIILGGANGNALRRFFQIDFNKASNPINDTNGNGVLETLLESGRDIDNSTNAKFDVLDIGGGTYTTAMPISQLITPVPTYFHDKVNGFIRSQNITGSAGMVLGESRQTTQFEMEMNVKVSNEAGSQIVIGFGQKDSHDLRSGGFSLRYDPVAGTVRLFQQADGYNPPATSFQIAGPVAMPVIATVGSGAALSALPNTARIAVSLSAEKVVTFSVNGTLATFDLGGAGDDLSGYLSVRNQFNELQVHDMTFDLKGKYNQLRAGDLFSVGVLKNAAVEIKNLWQERQSSRVVQSSLETSTASLTEYVPMLGLAQKVFAAISKIISTHNAIVDDINTLFR